jgi:Ca2+-binding RTX toxin-like protein
MFGGKRFTRCRLLRLGQYGDGAPVLLTRLEPIFAPTRRTRRPVLRANAFRADGPEGLLPADATIAKTVALMKSIALSAVALLGIALVGPQPTTVRAATDSNLNLTITRVNSHAVLSWFGSNTMAYQVEASSNLTVWSSVGPMVAGPNATLFATNPLAGKPAEFFRVQRLLATITATFNPQTGILTITGDDLPNFITVSRDLAGNLRVNGGAVGITGGTPTVGNTTLIQIFGGAGSDHLALDETNGALPVAHLFGEAGNDTLIGGSGADILNGGPGDDTLFGMGGADSLLGGDDNDTVIGGDGDDIAQLGPGNDKFIWNPGDDTDSIEGGDGVDTVEVNGGNGDEQFTTTANGTRVRFDRLNPAPFALDIGTCENLVLDANGGNDSFSATGNLAALIKITVDGGPGDDTILGSNGIDLLIGGDGNDFIDGQQGNDLIFLGAGDDVFQWDPGDGSDTIEGQDGNDKLLFNGSAGSEIFDVAANGSRVRFTRNLGNIVMDLNGVEQLELNMLGGIDFFTVNDLTGTDLTNISTDLAGTLGGSSGDAAVDNVIINGTAADDIITVTSPGGALLITGLAASVLVEAFEAADPIRIQGLAGDDIIDASAVGAVNSHLILDGGPGYDILLGGAGADTLLGGDDDDLLYGGPGANSLDGGAGENIVINSGGPGGADVTIFGTEADDFITISRDAGGNILSNGVAIPGATIANTAAIRVFGRGGNDTITFDESNGALPAGLLFGGAGTNTLTGGSGNDFLFGGSSEDNLLGKGGTDFLFGGPGDDLLTGGDGGDLVFGGSADDHMIWNPGDDTDLNEGGSGTDTVEVNGGNGDEQFTVTANGTRVRFDRLNPAPFSIDIGTCENLVLNANGGNDSFSATGNLAALIKITVDGGPGNDTLLGSNGADILIGGDGNDFIDGQQGNDVIFLGAGDDVFQWDPGDGSDVIEGGDGNDKLLFNGSAGSEIFDVAANGARVRFTRNLGNIVMDLNGVEQLELNMLGGTDTFTVHNLAGTDLTNIITRLAGTIGGSIGDAAVDNVILNGTAADDTVLVTGSSGSVSVLGLFATVTVTGSEAANDRLTINALAGDDVVDASGLIAGIILLTLDGGDDHDVLIGSDGPDILLGGAGDDVLMGGPGLDILDGGTGDNIVIQD